MGVGDLLYDSATGQLLYDSATGALMYDPGDPYWRIRYLYTSGGDYTDSTVDIADPFRSDGWTRIQRTNGLHAEGYISDVGLPVDYAVKPYRFVYPHTAMTITGWDARVCNIMFKVAWVSTQWLFYEECYYDWTGTYMSYFAVKNAVPAGNGDYPVISTEVNIPSVTNDGIVTPEHWIKLGKLSDM